MKVSWIPRAGSSTPDPSTGVLNAFVSWPMSLFDLVFLRNNSGKGFDDVAKTKGMDWPLLWFFDCGASGSSSKLSGERQHS